MNREIKAQPQPAIYSGLNPRLRKAFISGRLAALLPSWICSSSAMGDLRGHAMGVVVHLIAKPQAAGDTLGEFLGAFREGTVWQLLCCLVKKIGRAHV